MIGPEDFPEELYTLSPGPDLAGLLARWRPHVAELPHEQATALLAAQAKQDNHDAAATLALVWDIARRCYDPIDPCAHAGEPGRGAAAQVALLCGWSEPVAADKIALARAVLVRLPRLRVLMDAGQMDIPTARAYATATRDYDDAFARHVVDRVLDSGRARSPGEVAEEVLRAALSADPGLGEERLKRAVARRRISSGRNNDGSVNLHARNLPPDYAAQILGGIRGLTDAARANGDRRSLGHLDVEVLRGLASRAWATLTDPECLDQLHATGPLDGDTSTGDDGSGDSGTGGSGTGGSSGPGGSGPGGSGRGGSSDARGNSSGGNGNGVDRTRGTGAGTDDNDDATTAAFAGAGRARNDGPTGEAAPAPHDRDMAWWLGLRDEVEPDDGHRGGERESQERGGHDNVAGPYAAPGRRVRPIRHPGRGLDIRIELGTLLRHDEHPAALARFGAVPPSLARLLLPEHSAGQWRYLLVDDTGSMITTNLLRRRPRGWQRRDHRYRSSVELVLTPTLLDELRRDPRNAAWTAILREIADSVAADARRPPPDPDRRFADARLRRRILAKTPRCVWPGCTEPAAACQVDHALDHGKGGPTDDANQWPLCRHHHNLKTNHGWTAHLTGPHGYRLTSPIGTTHAVDIPPAWAPPGEPWNDWRRFLGPFLTSAA